LWLLNRQAMPGLLAIGEVLGSVTSTSDGYEVRSRESKTCRLCSPMGYLVTPTIGGCKIAIIEG
jgi:hypothetical protein